MVRDLACVTDGDQGVCMKCGLHLLVRAPKGEKDRSGA